MTDAKTPTVSDSKKAPVATPDEKKPKTKKGVDEEVPVTRATSAPYATVLTKPHVSEKSATLADRGIYVFVVPNEVNKVEIAKAVRIQYNVDVVSVRTARFKGKAVGRGRRRIGVRRSWKKAFVELKKGQTISVVEGV